MLFVIVKKEDYGFFLETNYIFSLYHTGWWRYNHYRGSFVYSIVLAELGLHDQGQAAM